MKGNKFEWFGDGKLNLTYNCVEANILKVLAVTIHDADKFLKIKSYTYNDLKKEINNI